MQTSSFDPSTQPERYRGPFPRSLPMGLGARVHGYAINIALLAVLSWGCNACGDGAPTSRAEPSASSSASVVASKPSAKPDTVGSGRGVGVGSAAKVANTGGSGAILHTVPGLGAAMPGVVPQGTTVRVVEGPETKDGYTWWRVRLPSGGTGWISEIWLAPLTSGESPSEHKPATQQALAERTAVPRVSKWTGSVVLDSPEAAVRDDSAAQPNAEELATSFRQAQQAFRSRDYEAAFRIWMELANREDETSGASTLEQGDRTYYVLLSQMIVGWCYDRGVGVSRDPVKAHAFYLKVAEFGIPFMQHWVAIRYDDGKGVRENKREALVWYRRAALAGVVDAQYLLGTKYSKGQGVERDPKEAIRWYSEAAQKGHSPSQMELGFAYLGGEGTKRDCEKARFWASRASSSAVSTVEKFGAASLLQLINESDSPCRS